MVIKVECKVFCNRECESRHENSLDNRVVGPVDEQSELALAGPFLEHITNQLRIGVRDPHRGEDDAEARAGRSCLGGDLRGKLQVRQSAD